MRTEDRVGAPLWLFKPSITAWVCKLIGHKWQAVLPPTHASVCMVCLRCRENGWRLL